MANKDKSSKPVMSVASARELLRNSKLRSTPTRLVVLEEISKLARPISHAELSANLVPLGFDKSTLFRVLVELSDAGILARIDAGDHAWRFELRRDASGHESGDHPHFVCKDCGKVECLPDMKISFRNSSKKPAVTERAIDEVFLKGTCSDCNV